MNFDEKNIVIRNQVHLNGGRDFNLTSMGLIYKDGDREHFIGEWCRGRQKKEQISRVLIDEETFNLPKDKQKMIEAVKNKFLSIMRAQCNTSC